MRIIAGEWRGRRLGALQGLEVRPTADRVREAWMSSLAPRIPRARVLDLFAGSGALGLEALSRGADEAVFVERARGALEVLEANIALLGAEERATVAREEVFTFLKKDVFFDIALADPPYGKGLAARLVEHFQARPFARELWVEHGSSEELPKLPGLRQRRYGGTTLTTMDGGDPPGGEEA
ncbi:MAG: 16S rRNA (guanine(966)-N(2))-methyltransferase RsmD [Gemmatimonadota bacterium]